MKKEGYRRKIIFEKKNIGSHPSLPESTGFCRVVTLAGLLFYLDRSSHWLNRVLDRLVGSV